MEDSNTSQPPSNRKVRASKQVVPSSKVEFSDGEIEEYMRNAARMLYDIIVDYRKRHPEKVKPPDEPTDATKTEKSP